MYLYVYRSIFVKYNFVAVQPGATYDIQIQHTWDQPVQVQPVQVVKDKNDLEASVGNLATVVKGIIFI